MIPAKGFITEHQDRENGEYDKRDGLLEDFQLDQRERTTIHVASYPICGYLEYVLEEGDSPADQDDGEEPHALSPGEFLEAQMTIPSHRHEDVGKDQEQDRPNAFHLLCRKAALFLRLPGDRFKALVHGRMLIKQLSGSSARRNGSREASL